MLIRPDATQTPAANSDNALSTNQASNPFTTIKHASKSNKSTSEMSGKPQNTWKRDHTRLAQLAAKDEPTTEDIKEAKDIIFKTQLNVSVKTNQAKRDYAAIFGRCSWMMDEPSTQTEAWQRQTNKFNWAVLELIMGVQGIAVDCGEFAKKAEDHAAKVNARSASAKCGSAQAKAGEPKDTDNGWEFLLQW